MVCAFNPAHAMNTISAMSVELQPQVIAGNIVPSILLLSMVSNTVPGFSWASSPQFLTTAMVCGRNMHETCSHSQCRVVHAWYYIHMMFTLCVYSHQTASSATKTSVVSLKLYNSCCACTRRYVHGVTMLTPCTCSYQTLLVVLWRQL